jgi:hypothetical protein
VADEAVITDGDHLTYEAVRLHLAARADPDIFLDFSEGTNEAIGADGAAVQIAWLHDLYVRSEINIASDSDGDKFSAHAMRPAPVIMGKNLASQLNIDQRPIVCPSACVLTVE